ncbi:MAG: helix-turn-helix domain-containing protein [Clostridiales bacterium]|nr:helix-turn-helix domain-containing protein [Clostridiales bacterium]
MFTNKTADGRNNLCGLEIARLRTARKWSQRQMADQLQLIGLNLDKNAIQRIESGQRFITDIELRSIAILFGCTVDALYAGGG